MCSVCADVYTYLAAAGDAISKLELSTFISDMLSVSSLTQTVVVEVVVAALQWPCLALLGLGTATVCSMTWRRARAAVLPCTRPGLVDRVLLHSRKLLYTPSASRSAHYTTNKLRWLGGLLVERRTSVSLFCPLDFNRTAFTDFVPPCVMF